MRFTEPQSSCHTPSVGLDSRTLWVILRDERQYMANPRAFIGLDFDHNEDKKNLFVGQATNSSTPFTIEDWSSKSAFPQAGWEKKIKE